ncbi:MAG: trehalose-phosphatase [Actinomycetota bacterium]
MSAPTAERLAEGLRPLTEDPPNAAIFCDIDGTLAPIVNRPDESHVREEVPLLLSRLGRRYGCVACVSGRPVAEARRLVGVGSIAYVGSHGAEVMHAGEKRPRLLDAFASWEGRTREFVRDRQNERAFKQLRIRLEDKGPIKAFHWRGSPDEEAAETVLQGVAQEAETAGLDIHWGRKVLEVRPPVPVDKGQAVRALIERTKVRVALYGGDDVTDLDAFDALDALVAEGALELAVRVGVRSSEGPAAIVDRSDLAVEGVRGFTEVLAVLAEGA